MRNCGQLFAFLLFIRYAEEPGDATEGKSLLAKHKCDTCHSIELNVRTNIPEWANQEITVALEQDAVFTARGIYFLDGRQTKLHVIR